ncbi:acyltransferase family protein [Kribbella sp. NPDC056345]|uniref:acyltransferase family protein n=1 Tax=Kribbella sp. NPDC056345 TaxID=3345789 RepID=UPI0035DA9E84
MTQAELTRPVTTRRRAHLPALDGLRGVAIAGVLLFHTGQLGGGFLGVDLFFALSGYLITDLLLREVERTGVVSLAGFWGRRIRRLLPALAVMLVGVTVLVWFVGAPDLVRTALTDGPWVQANLINWHLLAESASYWERFGAERVFGHLWSIAVEEQFYLLWPLVVLGIARLSRQAHQRVALVAAAGAVASLVLMIVLLSPADPTRVYTGTDTRAFSLLLGALVATHPVRTAVLKAVGGRIGAVVALLAAGLGTAWVLVDGVESQWLFTGGLFAHSLAAALLIVLCTQAPDSLLAKGLGWRPLRGLGQISYSLYLWHWPVIVLLPDHITGWLRTVVVCAVSIALATLSKYLVEDPIRFRANWAKGRTGLIAFVAVMVGLAALWLLLPAPDPTLIDITGLN